MQWNSIHFNCTPSGFLEVESVWGTSFLSGQHGCIHFKIILAKSHILGL